VGGEGGAGDRTRGQVTVADGDGGGLAGGAFRGELDGVAQAAQAGVAVRREFRGEQEAVVVARVVGALVGEEGFTLGGAETAEHRGGDDDAVRSAGQGAGVRVRRVVSAAI
jgi:hypothetical protein